MVQQSYKYNLKLFASERFFVKKCQILEIFFMTLIENRTRLVQLQKGCITIHMASIVKKLWDLSNFVLILDSIKIKFYENNLNPENWL